MVIDAHSRKSFNRKSLEDKAIEGDNFKSKSRKSRKSHRKTKEIDIQAVVHEAEGDEKSTRREYECEVARGILKPSTQVRRDEKTR